MKRKSRTKEVNRSVDIFIIQEDATCVKNFKTKESISDYCECNCLDSRRSDKSTGDNPIMPILFIEYIASHVKHILHNIVKR